MVFTGGGVIESEWVDIFSEGYHIKDDVADLDSDS